MPARHGFLESRLGLGALSRRLATEKRPPRTTSWLHTIGWAAVSILALQFATGIALAFFYVPAADHAYDSIRYMERDVPGAVLLRALHHWGASAMVVLVFAHALRVFFQGAYKRPRELTWLLGLGLLAAVLGLAFTGYLLPWDQKAYFATKVGVNIAGQAPLVGDRLRGILFGGDGIGPQTLNRFFALHVLVLPGILVPFLALHLWQVQRHGIAPAGTRVGDPGLPGKPYHPYHTVKEGCVALLAVGIVWILAARLGAPLEAEASGADLAYEPRPDWYFLAPFELLKQFTGKNEAAGAFWIPAGFATLLVLLPFVDRNPERRIGKRRVCLVLGVVFVVAVAYGTLRGALDRPKQYRTPPHPLGASTEVKRGYDLVRAEGCLSCHQMTLSADEVYGRSREGIDAPDMMDFDKTPPEVAEFLLDPDSDDMPPFPYLSEAERLAIGRYLEAARR